MLRALRRIINAYIHNTLFRSRLLIVFAYDIDGTRRRRAGNEIVDLGGVFDFEFNFTRIPRPHS